MQSASTDDLVFDIATLISVLSVAFTLEAGDVCEVELEGIGVLRNPVVAQGQ